MRFFEKTRLVTEEGYMDAVSIWERVMAVRVDTPPGLAAFTLAASDEFYRLWATSHFAAPVEYTKVISVDWEATSTVLRARKVFEVWGEWIGTTFPDVQSRCLGAGARLFARLPKWDYENRDGKSNVPCWRTLFYPRATLPNASFVGLWSGYVDDLFRAGNGVNEVVSLVVTALLAPLAECDIAGIHV